MPQKRKPPRLWLRTETDANGKPVSTWIIKDGGRNIRTGCGAFDVEEADRKLAEYRLEKYEAPRGGRSTEILIGDVILVYARDVSGSTSRPKETQQALDRLNDFMGDKPVAEIRGKLCRSYAEHRNTASGARRDLEVLRAATNYYHAEHGLDVLPRFTLPAKGTPRQRFMTRQEAAALLWACMGWEKVRTGDDARWTRRKGQKRMHLARLILIGLYTGTRPGAIKSLQWIRNTSGGWVDLDRGVIFRRAEGERVAHNKRKPPVKMARRLVAHAARWKRLDGWEDDKVGLRYVVHYLGAAVTKENKAFRSAIAAAGLSSDVTPHILRHTRGTWLAQAGVPATEAASSLGLTVEEYERTYLHNDPAFQQRAADAF
jgi:integrase